MGQQLIETLHTAISRIAHNGPPLDSTVQLCAVVAFLDLAMIAWAAHHNLSRLRSQPWAAAK